MSTPTSLKNPIETNISNLINSTKVFLKALTRWTQQLETQKSISNHYVQLGTDFRIVVKQFTHLGIDMSEVRNVPKELRPILEKALKEKPSNESLDKYWPSIKGIIEDLLNTLKFKRLLLKKLNQDVTNNNQENKLNTKSVSDLDLNKIDSNKELNNSPSPTKAPSPIIVETTSEFVANKHVSPPYYDDIKESSPKPLLDDSADTSTSKLDPESEMKKKKLSNFLRMSGFGDESESSESEEFFDDYDDDEEDILTSKQMLNALKTDNKIERRASKRYSAYHMAKGNVTSTGNISDTSKLPALPTTGQFSIEKVNDSLNVSSTEKVKLNDTHEGDEVKLVLKDEPKSHKEEDIKPTSESSQSDLIDNVKIEKLNSNNSTTSSTGSNKLLNKLKDKSIKAVHEDEDLIKNHKRNIAIASHSNETIIYLKHGERTLKRVIENSNYESVFTEYNKAFGTDFSLNNHDLLVKMSDPSSSIFYEVEDVKSLEKHLQNGSGFEIVQKMTTNEHEDKFLELEKKLEIMMDNYEQRIKEEINQKMTMSPSPEPAADKDAKTNKETLVLKKALVKLDKEHKEAMSEMKSKLERLQKELHEKDEMLSEMKQKEESTPTVSSSNEIDDGKYVDDVSNKISNDGDMILNKIDDLQDVIEILRKDVAIRGVKPKESNLDKINKTLEDTKKELVDFESYLKLQKPELKSKWEKQLIKICDQQQMLTLQEDLVIDLKVDLEKCKETMDLVIKCNEERLKLKSKSHTENDQMKVILPLTKPSELQGVRDQLLQDIQFIKPDHQSRIEAIEKHEKFNEINK